MYKVDDNNPTAGPYTEVGLMVPKKKETEQNPVCGKHNKANVPK